MNRLAITLTALCLALTACGSGAVAIDPGDSVDPTTAPTTTSDPDPGVEEPNGDPADASPMLILFENGGCLMAGPYCRTMSFWADGHVDVEWPTEADRPVDTHVVDSMFVAAWLDIANSTDFDALVARLPEGECQGCYDGIDLVLDITLDGQTITLDSMEVEFVPTEPLFSAASDLAAAVPFELGEPAISSDPTEWNAVVDPVITIDGMASGISAELPVVELTGRALGGGLLGASIGSVSADAEFMYLEIGRSTGCAMFEHLALTPTADTGVYELFVDTDNVCKAAMTSGFRTPLADLAPAEDGTVTLIDTNGNATTVALG